MTTGNSLSDFLIVYVCIFTNVASHNHDPSVRGWQLEDIHGQCGSHQLLDVPEPAAQEPHCCTETCQEEEDGQIW